MTAWAATNTFQAYIKMLRCYGAYLDCAYLSWSLVEQNSLCHLLDDNFFRLAAFLVSLIDEGDLGARDQCLLIGDVTRMDKYARALCQCLVSSRVTWRGVKVEC